MTLFDASAAEATEPTRFVAGDLVMWRRTDLSDYVGGAYSLTYVIRPSAGGESEITATATVVNGEFRITLSSPTTAPMVPGRWYWSAYLTRTSDSARVQVDDGEFTVEANRAVDPSDTRSHAQRTLDAIEAVIEGRATDAVQSYTIGGRQINKMGADDLIRWRNYYRTEVAAEIDAARRRDGKPARNTITVRFV